MKKKPKQTKITNKQTKPKKPTWVFSWEIQYLSKFYYSKLHKRTSKTRSI